MSDIERRAGAGEGAELSIERLDELLEVLYWMQGEGFAEEATLARLARFLTYPQGDIAVLLRRLVARGEVREVGGDPPTFVLTEVGRREGGRRFGESFAPLLSQGHGECNDPDCDCMNDPAACRHREPSAHGVG